MPETAQKQVLVQKTNNREERFCYAYVNSGNKYEAFDLAGYEASTVNAKQAAVSRMLRKPHIKARIKHLEREYFMALGVDEKRIIGNIAEIAFNDKNNKVDRMRALELLGRNRGMFKDVMIDATDHKPPVLSPEELVLARKVAIKLTPGSKEAV